MQRTTWRKRAITLWVVAVLAVVAGLLTGALRGNGGAGPSGSDPPSSASSVPTDDTSTPTPDPDVPEGDLEVRQGDILPVVARCASDEFIPNSLPSTEKLWSDSVSTPYVSQDPNEMFTELMAENCGNPTVLDMTVQGLRTVRIGDFSIWDHNPWMAEFLDLVDEHGLRAAFLTKKDGQGEAIFVTAKYQLFAEMVNTILLDYNVQGVALMQSVRNWHLPGPTAGELPRTVENENQEGLPALVLSYILKDNCRAASVIGYNVGDKRFEVFGSPKCEQPPCTNCGTTTTTEVGRKGAPPTTTPPPPTTQPSGPTTTTLQCVYDGTHRDPATGQCVTGSPPATTTPDGTIPSTTSPPGPGTTVLGP